MPQFTSRNLTAAVLVVEAAIIFIAIAVTKIWTKPTPWAPWVSFGVLLLYAAALVAKRGRKHEQRRSSR
jgi:hypothetical protein